MPNLRLTLPIILAVLIAAAPGGAGGDKKKADDAKDWKTLFDGKTLKNWKSTNFGGEGEVSVKDGAIVLERGNDMTGITFAGKDFPKTNYEVTFEGKRVKGNDFFCTTTFPVGKDFCSLVVGGWGGNVVGISRVNGNDAVENETTQGKEFKLDRWYRIKIRVTKDKVLAWIDDDKMVDLETKGKKITIRGECEASKPFGVSTWRTEGAVRDIRIRTLK